MSAQLQKNLYMYLGRRGALSRWIVEIAETTRGQGALAISRQNENVDQVLAIDPAAVVIDTFESSLGALLRSPRIVAMRRAVVDVIRQRRITKIVNLMPHVWTPFLANAVRREGAKYVVVVHDAWPHPGDTTGRVHWWLMHDALRADHVITLSRHVADELTDRFPGLRGKVSTLFLPSTGAVSESRTVSAGRPLRFLLFGRIMPYKGHDLLVDACEILRREKLPFDISVVGEGHLDRLQPRLAAIGATIVNRWISDDDVAAIMQTHDVVVVPNLEASQSGVISTAFALGRPVVVTPVGGLIEQVHHGRDGLVAEAVSGEAVATQMRQLIANTDLYKSLESGVRLARERTSMRRFLDALDTI